MFNAAFFKDKVVLLLGLIMGLLGLLNILSVLLRADTGQSSTILRYWTTDGIAEFDKQTPTQLYSFVLLAILVMGLTTFISFKIYDKHKHAAYIFFVLAQLTIIFNIVVSGAILNLQQ